MRLLAGWLLVVLLPVSAWAEGGRVVVVQPVSGAVRGWPAATRAALAELALAGFEVTVQRTGSADLEQMIANLQLESERAGVVAAVLITRTDATGTAHVWLRGAESALSLSENDPDGAVAQGGITLKLTELVRERRLQLPAPGGSLTEPATPAPSPRPVSSRESVATPWLALGSLWSKNGSLAPLAALGTQLRLPADLCLDLASAATLSSMNARSEAGTAELDAASFGAHLLVDPWRSEPVSFAAGAGASALWIRSRATPRDGYTGLKDTGAVVVLAATLRMALRRGPLGLQLMLEPGVAVPSVRVLAGDSELVRLGRPVVTALAGVSWDL